ncbi:hypothetical protein [Qipengyuania aquimaris]|uniref:hypothetical protein n=1 Tax=Qipengyuania aquimaris TaxID=255984 RepID=UPI001FD44E85|nr:hypothetical protein [Qipengyuania aquimaris]UOR16263.1 hypothetical protein LCM05_04255 [Qipengyuania aquimaris]
MSGYPWSILGIEETREKSAIRKAYSVKLKTMNLDEQVQEYAQLRDARDYALRLAAQPPPPPPSSAQPEYDDAYEDDDYFDELEWHNDAEFEWEIGRRDFVDGYEGGDLGDAGLSGDELAAAAIEPPELPDGYDELHAILFPGRQHSDEGLTGEEYEQAEGALKRLIAWAEDGDLNRHGSVDYNLAEMLAAAWPRSAPLVERANVAFHWLGEAGGLDERPALQFLNARTQGMRFHEAVLEEDHPLHKAWLELSRPGKASMIDRLKINRNQIDKLLLAIRGSFPELEALLSRERIDSWEKPASDVVSWIVQRLFIVFVVIQALRFCASADDRAPVQPPLSAEEEQAIRDEGKDTIAAALFGDGFTYDQLVETDPAFAAQLGTMIDTLVRAKVLDGRLVLPLLRNRMLAARERADFDTLLAIQAVHLEWLKAASDAGGDACGDVLSGSFSGGAPEVSAETEERERALARDLLEKKLLTLPSRTGSTTYQIPGWLVDAARKDTGLSEARFGEILQDPEDSERCAVEIALIENMLSAPSRVPIETLRSL